MTLQTQSIANNSLDIVKQVAHLIRTFSPEQINQLLNLVPELHLPESELFIAGLTYQQFFALPVVEKNQLWQETMTKNKEIATPEQTQALFDQLSRQVRSHHVFMKMSQDEILQTLRQTREEVWQEHHDD